MNGARKSTALAINAAIAVLALVLVVVLVVLVLAYSFPRSASRLGLDIVMLNPAAATTAGDIAGITRSVTDRAIEGFDYRIAPVLDRLSGAGTPSKTESEGPEPFPEGSCTECHPNWKERPLFSVVYMPHDRHSASDVPCDRCHEASGPARDSVPAMSICAECHDETADGSKKCATCHPPGSLFHGAQLTSSRTIGEQCDTCHSPASLSGNARSHDVMVFDNSADSCSQCHTADSCARCHPATHPAAYAGKHFGDLRAGRRVQIQCYSCHSPARCSNCHSARRSAR